MENVNILQLICSTGFYGAERWILALAKNIEDTNIRCDLAVTEESVSQNMEIVRQFPNNNSQAFKLQMNGRFDLSVISQLSDLIKQREIDVIHTHGYKSDILGLLAAKRNGIKSISTPHGFGESTDFKLNAYIRIGAFCLRFFDRVVPLSTELLNEIIKYGVPIKKTNYIQNGVDLKELDDMRLTSDYQAKSSEKRIGFIGQMIPGKNITEILDIFNFLWQKDNNLLLLLLGDGKSRTELEAYSKTLPCNEKIQFLGFRSDRLDLLKSFDLFVMTSSSEGIPRCLMEAMAMEIPVAAYGIPGIAQLIKDKETGLLATFGDQENLIKCWEKLIYDIPYAQHIAAQGRKFVLENFSATRMAREYVGLYKEMLNAEST